MSWLRLHPAKQRRAPQGKRAVTLSPSQIRWLGALLLSTQLPMIAYGRSIGMGRRGHKWAGDLTY